MDTIGFALGLILSSLLSLVPAPAPGQPDRDTPNVVYRAPFTASVERVETSEIIEP